jgi:hypothetical protein
MYYLQPDPLSFREKHHLSHSEHNPYAKLHMLVTSEAPMPVMFFMQCHNILCPSRLWLPPGGRPDTECTHPPWPTDGLPRNFACLICNEVSSYSSSECQCDPRPPWKTIFAFRLLSLICIEMTCSQEGCGSPFLIHTAGPKKLATAISHLPNAIAFNALCERGHLQNGLIIPDSHFFARPVFDWNL